MNRQSDPTAVLWCYCHCHCYCHCSCHCSCFWQLVAAATSPRTTHISFCPHRCDASVTLPSPGAAWIDHLTASHRDPVRPHTSPRRCRPAGTLRTGLVLECWGAVSTGRRPWRGGTHARTAVGANRHSHRHRHCHRHSHRQSHSHAAPSCTQRSWQVQVPRAPSHTPSCRLSVARVACARARRCAGLAHGRLHGLLQSRSAL